MADFTAPSGAKVSVTISSYEICFDLLRAVRKVTLEKGKTIENVDVLIDPDVDRLIYKCMERATYDDQRITRETFELEARRGDFLPIASEIMSINLNPFVPGLSSASKDISQGTNSSRQSK